VGKRRTAKISSKPVSFLILEGDTEQIFYSIIRDKFLRNIQIELRNIRGQGNINKDILREIFKYTYNNPGDRVRAYCCIDAEKLKTSATPFELELIRNKARERNMAHVLSIDGILADPDIESWFFYDIEGIYKFLGAKRSQRNIRKYSNVSKLGKKDLHQLFGRFKEEYFSGNRAKHFINNLNIENIVSKCKELSEGIKLIRSQANDLTNHLFPPRKNKSN